jgi:hypothetical protein
MDDMKKHLLTHAGVAMMVIAFIWSLFPSDSNVPNDANIGAGVLFIFGGAIVIAGLSRTWARRSSVMPPAPGPSD